MHDRCVFQRFLPTGAIDTSFGTDGVVDLSSTSAGSNDRAWCEVAASSDGSLLVASRDGGYAEVSDLVRIAQSGAIVDAFPGVSTKRVNGAVEFGGKMPDGSLLVIKSTRPGWRQQKSVLERWAPDGSLDTSWGTSGSWPVPDRLLLASTTDEGHVVVASQEDVVTPDGYRQSRWQVQRIAP